MKEALIIFIVLLILLMIISVFGGSIRYTPTTYAGVPSFSVMPGAGSIRGLGGSVPMPTSWEGFDSSAVHANAKVPGAASSPTASSGSSVSSGTVGGTANLASSPAGNAMGATTAQGGTSTAPPAPLPKLQNAAVSPIHPTTPPTSTTTVEPFGSPEFAPF